jgi:2-oxoglutarate dehydrogenase E1 component
VRFSGQDSQRGTFSHRHAVYTDTKTGRRWSPLYELGENQGKFEIYNSPLSEYAVLAFEFGYSLIAPGSLVLWEAQFGDFANGAQIIIDNFLVSGEDKWNRLNGLVLMLPHGFEGQGPEHSSARIERFLQLAAEDNIQVVNLTTPGPGLPRPAPPGAPPVAQAPDHDDPQEPPALPTRRSRRSPTSSTASFQRAIDDNQADPAPVTRVMLSAGKVFYDLKEQREQLATDKVALVRVEQLYPFPTPSSPPSSPATPTPASSCGCRRSPRTWAAGPSCARCSRSCSPGLRA